MLGATGYESLSNGVSYEKTSVNFLSDLQQSPTQSSHSAALWSLSLTESCHCVLPSTLCSLTLLLLISNIFPWNLILLPVLRLEQCADGPRVRRWGRGRPLNTRSPLCVASQLWPALYPPARGNCWGHVWLRQAWSEVWDYTEGLEHLVYGFFTNFRFSRMGFEALCRYLSLGKLRRSSLLNYSNVSEYRKWDN